MLLELLRDHRILFFGGKGGVGKTTLAAAAALALADAGRKVLLVSTDPAHNLGHIWDREIGDHITEVTPGLSVIEVDPATQTSQHLAQVGETMRAMMPEHLHGEVRRHLQLAEQSPGTHEAALLEKIAGLVAETGEDFEHLIFDTAPSGHTSRLMELPEIMAAWTDGLLDRRARSEKFSAVVRGLSPTGRDGLIAEDPVDRRNRQLRSVLLRRRERFEQLRSALSDPATCRFFIVLTPERMPVLETLEFQRQLAGAGVAVGGCVVNRCSPTDQGEFLATRAELEAGFIAQLRTGLPNTPVVQLPLLAGDITGRAALQEFAQLL